MSFQQTMVSFALAACLALPATAQRAPGTQEAAQGASPAEAERAQKLREQKALTALEEIIAEIPSLKLPENRVRVQMTAADLLWPRDEKRARTYFQEATAGLTQMMSRIDSGDPRYYELVRIPVQLRREMLQVVGRRDAQLALEFLRSTRPPQPPQSYPGQQDAELQLEYSLISMAAANDPKRALRMAEESLAKGFAYELTGILSQLQTADPEAAASLAASIVGKLRGENLITNLQAAGVAANLMAMLQAPGRTDSSKQTTAPRLLSDSTIKDLIEAVAAAALSASSYPTGSAEWNQARSLLDPLNSVLPQVQKYAPARAAALRPRLAERDQANSPAKLWQDFQQLAQQGTPEQLLEQAKKAPPELSAEMYQQAAWKAANAGDDARAKQIINDYLPNPGERQLLLNQIEQNALQRLVGAGKFDEAQAALTRLRSDEERVGVLLQIAHSLVGQGNKKAAAQWIEQARAVTGNQAETLAQFVLQLRLVNAYAAVDIGHSAEIIGPLTDRLNSVVAASAVLGEFEGQGGFKNGEMQLQYGGGGQVGALQAYAAELAHLARFDFDTAVAALNRLERNEVRLQTRLHLVADVLGGTGAVAQPVVGRGFGRLVPLQQGN